MASSQTIHGPEIFENIEENNVRLYVARRFSDPYDRERGIQPFYLNSLHDFYAKHSHNWDSNSAKLLEFGGGPVIYSLITAAPHVASIVHSDYAENNLKQVLLWRDRAALAHNWIPYFEYVIRELEGVGTDSASRREEELRAKLRDVVRCDVTCSDVLETTKFPMESFDIISSCFCFEAVADTTTQYADFIERVSRYLKPGGYFVSLVSTEESWYLYGTKKLTHLFLTAKDIRTAYETAGLHVVDTAFTDVPPNSQNILNDCKGILFIACQKKQ